MTRIIYARPDKDNADATLEMQGTGDELLRALVQIVYSFHNRLGLDVERFAVTLPALVKLEELSLRETVTIDKSMLRKEDGE